MAKASNGVTKKTELKFWSSQSILVDAYVSLSEGGYDGPFIKIRLRRKYESLILVFLFAIIMFE